MTNAATGGREMTTAETLIARYHVLQALVQSSDQPYYETKQDGDGQDNPENRNIADDGVYDTLKEELLLLEARYPDLFGRYGTVSVTARIGQASKASPNLPDTGVLPHLTPMLSLDNTKTEAELLDFLRRLKEALHWQEGDRELQFSAEHKFDGMSMGLLYRRGELIQASTRGNGTVGADSTSRMLKIGVPQTLPPEALTGLPDEFEVRGEVMLPKANFDRINEDFAAKGVPALKNPRNAANGILNRGRQNLDMLTFTAYGLEGQDRLPFRTQADLAERLTRLGFTTPDTVILQFPEDMNAMHAHLQATREQLPYEIDGLVLKLDDLNARAEAGTTSTAPRWATAFKFREPQVSTLLEAITVDVGKTGELSPRAVLQTVRLAGSDISSATLHNASYITAMDIRPGDHVIIEKAGGVIPKVVRRDESQPRTNPEPFSFPDQCPVCSAPVALTPSSNGQPEYHCTNEHCPRRIYKRLEFFCTKDGMDIKGLGDSILSALFDSGRVTDAADLYTLTQQDLAGTYTTDEGGIKRATGPKTALKILSQIDESRTRELPRLINALALRLTGEGTSGQVARVAGTLEGLMLMSIDDFRNIRDVGEKTAASLWNELHSPRLQDLIARLVRHGVSPARPKDTVTGQQLNGLAFVLTGTLSTNRDTAKSHLKQHGADVTNSVTKKTSYLVVGEDGGGKILKAQTLGVPMISEVELSALLVERGVAPL